MRWPDIDRHWISVALAIAAGVLAFSGLGLVSVSHFHTGVVI